MILITFRQRDAQGARDFAHAAREAGVRRVVYLGGLSDENEHLSEHLRSRQETGRSRRRTERKES